MSSTFDTLIKDPALRGTIRRVALAFDNGRAWIDLHDPGDPAIKGSGDLAELSAILLAASPELRELRHDLDRAEKIGDAWKALAKAAWAELQFDRHAQNNPQHDYSERLRAAGMAVHQAKVALRALGIDPEAPT